MSDQEYASQRYRQTTTSNWDDRFLDDRVRAAFDNLHMPSIGQASIGMVRDIGKTIPTEDGFQFDRPAAIVRLILDSVRKGGVINEIDSAERDAWRASDYLANASNVPLVRNEAVTRAQTQGLILDVAANWLNVINDLGRSQSWALNAVVQQTRQRQARIRRITDGHSTYPVWVAAHGQFRYLPVEFLENESDEMIDALAQKVPGWRVQIAGGRVAKPATQTDGLGEVKSERAATTTTEDEFLAFPGDPSREYTIREAKYALRELLFLPGSKQSRGPRRVAAVNRLLSGRKFGE